MISIDELITPLSDLTIHDRQLIANAYNYAQSAHHGQKRRSGEDYFVHCVEVAKILAEMNLDTSVIAASLLHDVIEDTPHTREDIQSTFGEEVARLVDGVTKLDRVPLDAEHTSKGRPRDRDAEFLRKTLLAMDDDVRVILIKLADRLHNMRTLGHLSHEQQTRMARETLEIFAPLASRLGIWQMKWELEDLGFRYLYPTQYRTIANLVEERRADREAYMQCVITRVKKVLDEYGILADVSGRSKHIYSIWQKMDRKRLPFDQIFDVRAVRVIVPDTATCYQTLGIIHATWRPIAGEFDDYIAAPKDNFYQSLHTAVIYEDGKTLEVQIRTPDMHVHAEYGVAAHWRYKEGHSKQSDEAYERRIKHLRSLMAVGRDVDDADEYLDIVKSEVFQDRVYAFTPKGDIIDLPLGSTAIDFAYHIHTDVGHRCRGAKVNGKLVSLDYILQTGDRVEILTSKRGGPSRDWLNPHLGYVKTKRAAAKIRQWFRRRDRDEMITLGREVLDRELRRLGLTRIPHEQVASQFGIDKASDLLAQIGFGDIHPQHIATKVLEIEQATAPNSEMELAQHLPPLPQSRVAPDGIRVHGTGGLLTHLARCCNPVQGDEIVGYITRGRGVTIHRSDCPNVLNLRDKERLISVEWSTSDAQSYPVPVVITAYDREGLMRDIGAAVADEHINVRNVTVDTQNHIATFSLIMEVHSTTHLSRILEKLERLPNVIETRRTIS